MAGDSAPWIPFIQIQSIGQETVTAQLTDEAKLTLKDARLHVIGCINLNRNEIVKGQLTPVTPDELLYPKSKRTLYMLVKENHLFLDFPCPLAFEDSRSTTSSSINDTYIQLLWNLCQTIICNVAGTSIALVSWEQQVLSIKHALLRHGVLHAKEETDRFILPSLIITVHADEQALALSGSHPAQSFAKDIKRCSCGPFKLLTLVPATSYRRGSSIIAFTKNWLESSQNPPHARKVDLLQIAETVFSLFESGAAKEIEAAWLEIDSRWCRYCSILNINVGATRILPRGELLSCLQRAEREAFETIEMKEPQISPVTGGSTTTLSECQEFIHRLQNQFALFAKKEYLDPNVDRCRGTLQRLLVHLWQFQQHGPSNAASMDDWLILLDKPVDVHNAIQQWSTFVKTDPSVQQLMDLLDLSDKSHQIATFVAQQQHKYRVCMSQSLIPASAITDESKIEESKTDESKIKESKTDESKIEESKTDESPVVTPLAPVTRFPVVTPLSLVSPLPVVIQAKKKLTPRQEHLRELSRLFKQQIANSDKESRTFDTFEELERKSLKRKVDTDSSESDSASGSDSTKNSATQSLSSTKLRQYLQPKQQQQQQQHIQCQHKQLATERQLLQRQKELDDLRNQEVSTESQLHELEQLSREKDTALGNLQHEHDLLREQFLALEAENSNLQTTIAATARSTDDDAEDNDKDDAVDSKSDIIDHTNDDTSENTTTPEHALSALLSSPKFLHQLSCNLLEYVHKQHPESHDRKMGFFSNSISGQTDVAIIGRRKKRRRISSSHNKEGEDYTSKWDRDSMSPDDSKAMGARSKHYDDDDDDNNDDNKPALKYEPRKNSSRGKTKKKNKTFEEAQVEKKLSGCSDWDHLTVPELKEVISMSTKISEDEQPSARTTKAMLIALLQKHYPEYVTAEIGVTPSSSSSSSTSYSSSVAETAKTSSKRSRRSRG